jgi:hypothetical protein
VVDEDERLSGLLVDRADPVAARLEPVAVRVLP